VTPDEGDPGRSGILDVPTAVVPTNRSDRRRAYTAVGAVVLVIGAAIGLSALADRSGIGEPPRGQVIPAIAPSGPVVTPRQADATPLPARVERLPDIANVGLPGAGRLLLVARSDDDAEILAWSPGDESVVLERSFADAFSRTELPQITSLAPDGRSLLVFTIEDFDDAGKDRAILFDETGHRAWDRAGVTALSGAVWSADSNRLAVTGERGAWILAGRDGDAFTDRVVSVADPPAPAASRTLPPYDERLQPVGFSEDGAWVYGAHQSATNGIGAPFIRASFDTGVVEELASLPALDGSGPFLDGNGRSIGFTLNASTPGGPPSLAILEPDGSVAYRIETEQLMGLAFAGGGQVLVLSAERFNPAGRVRLVAYDRDGRAGEPLLDIGPVTSAGLTGVRAGFAAVVLSTASPERAAQLIVIRLADGHSSAVRLRADDASAIVGTGWLAGP
jgi:hypothetical protein